MSFKEYLSGKLYSSELLPEQKSLGSLLVLPGGNQQGAFPGDTFKKGGNAMNYEKPLLIDFAMEDRAEGKNNCKSGVYATNQCSLGSTVGGPAPLNCNNGSSATGRCRAGASASGGCSLGSLAA